MRVMSRMIKLPVGRNTPERKAIVREFLYDERMTGRRVVVTHWTDTGSTWFQALQGDARYPRRVPLYKVYAELTYVMPSIDGDALIDPRKIAANWAREHFHIGARNEQRQDADHHADAADRLRQERAGQSGVQVQNPAGD